MLHVSQPSVTKAIKALETEFQMTLVNRRQRKLELTEAGKTFLVHAKRLMQEMERTRQDMNRFCSDKRGVIRFGLPPVTEAYLFPEFFRNFRRDYPDILLDVQECSDSHEIRDRADKGEIDFGIIIGGIYEKEKTDLQMMEDEMVVCMSKNHPLAGHRLINIKELVHERFIMQQPNTYQYQSVMETCYHAGFAPVVDLCTSQLKTIKQIVASGMGISILPRFVTMTDKNYVCANLEPPIRLRVSLYWGLHKAISPTDQQLLNFVRTYTQTQEFKEYFHQN